MYTLRTRTRQKLNRTRERGECNNRKPWRTSTFVLSSDATDSNALHFAMSSVIFPRIAELPAAVLTWSLFYASSYARIVVESVIWDRTGGRWWAASKRAETTPRKRVSDSSGADEKQRYKLPRERTRNTGSIACRGGQPVASPGTFIREIDKDSLYIS